MWMTSSPCFTLTPTPGCLTVQKPFSPHLNSKLQCQVTLWCGYVSHLALPPCACPPPPRALFVPLGLQHPPHQARMLPSYPALVLTPCVKLPSSGNILLIFIGFWLHTPGPPLHGGPLHSAHVQLSVPVVLGLLPLKLGCPVILDALLRGHPPHQAQASTPHARLGLCGGVLAWAPAPCALPYWQSHSA